MERYRTKKGFTLIEMLIGGTILVIVMALISVFFAKASKIRSVVSKENNTQVTASQMINALMSGVSQLSDGLMYATRIEAIDETNGESPLWVTFANHSDEINNNYVRLKIRLASASVTTDTTLYQQTDLISAGYSGWTDTSPNPKDLDPNDKINIESGSWFGCYDSQDRNVLTPGLYANTEQKRAAIAKIEICLTVKDKNLPASPAFILRNIVTISNIYHID